MLIGVAGVPAQHFNSFQQQSGKLAGSGHTVFGAPCRMESEACRPCENDAVVLMARAIDIINKTPSAADDGFGVMCLAHDWYNISGFENIFFPSSLVLKVPLPHPILVDGNGGREYFNKVLRALSLASPRLIRATRATASEVKARRNRSPILLPLKNFGSERLVPAIRELSSDLLNVDHPSGRIKQACDEIEAAHPFTPKGDGKGFRDSENIIFRSPGRDLHGQVWDRPGDGHEVACNLNARFRLGGPIAHGFHYDCTRPPFLQGYFSNCHGQTADYKGKPHLNVSPNDFIR